MITNLKVPFGTAKMVRVTGAKYLAWEDAFEVDFEDGLTFLEPHATIRKANKISPTPRLSVLNLMKNLALASSSTTTTARPPKSRGHLFGNSRRRIQRNDDASPVRRRTDSSVASLDFRRLAETADNSPWRASFLRNAFSHLNTTSFFTQLESSEWDERHRR